MKEELKQQYSKRIESSAKLQEAESVVEEIQRKFEIDIQTAKEKSLAKIKIIEKEVGAFIIMNRC